MITTITIVFFWHVAILLIRMGRIETTNKIIDTFPHNVYISTAFSVDSIIEKNRPFFPWDTKFNILLNSEMDISVLNLSKRLEKEGFLKGLYEAYSNLTPWSFRVDLWQYAILFLNGGIYLDAKMILKENYSSWVDVEGTKLSLCWDYREKVYGTGVMASRARNPVLLSVLKHMVLKVKRRYYGLNCLSVTGPEALHGALKLGHHLADIHGKCVLADIKWKDRYSKKTLIIKSYPDKSKVLITSNLDVHYRGKHCKTCNDYSQLWRERKVYCDRLKNQTGFEHCNKSKELLISIQRKLHERKSMKMIKKESHGKISSDPANPAFNDYNKFLNELYWEYLCITSLCILIICFLARVYIRKKITQFSRKYFLFDNHIKWNQYIRVWCDVTNVNNNTLKRFNFNSSLL